MGEDLLEPGVVDPGDEMKTSIEKRLEYDFYYIQNWSIGLDIRILWMTLRKGFIDKSVK